jgi:hypothetical protein
MHLKTTGIGWAVHNAKMQYLPHARVAKVRLQLLLDVAKVSLQLLLNVAKVPLQLLLNVAKVPLQLLLLSTICSGKGKNSKMVSQYNVNRLPVILTPKLIADRAAGHLMVI